MPFDDNTFDAAYAIEAICHAPNPQIVYRELRRVLKPGAPFGEPEWVMTEKFDSAIKKHRVIRDQIERGNGLAKMPLISEVWTGLEQCGFQLTHEENMELRSTPGPWYYPMLGMLRYITCWDDFLRTLLMERKVVVPLVDAYYWILVKCGVVPKEFTAAFEMYAPFPNLRYAC